MSRTPSKTQIAVPIRVTYGQLAENQSQEFSAPFRIGRSAECEVCIRNDFVSRFHAEVSPEGAFWRIRDLNSSNGLYLDGKRVEGAQITYELAIRLGVQGPEVSFVLRVEQRNPQPSAALEADEERILAQYAKRYFGQAADTSQPVGEHTLFIRRAFSRIQFQQRQRHTRLRWVYSTIIFALLLSSIGAAVLAAKWHRETMRQRAIARSLFYSMKMLDVEIAETEHHVLASDHEHGAETVSKYEARRQELQRNYDQFLATLHVYDPKSSEQHRLILRVARIFGECELDMPPDFEKEVMKYIGYWQSSGRFNRDIQIAKNRGYIHSIPHAMLAQGLPVQFFYLAMQESDFDVYASGPMTRAGIAKGMWQFVPETGLKFGLHLGPLVELRRPDPSDERDQVDKSTLAASRYLQMLYSTDAQASGLLVMACYNWGEAQVLPLVRRMPPNPRERNFWRLLEGHREQIPQETHDYVFYITSAAVIGENPRLFGFDFDNPLENTR